MNYNEFVSAVQNELSLLLCDKAEITICCTLKNNGCERTGILIHDSKAHISPTIYMEEFYEAYQDGASAAVIADEILSIYNNLKSNPALPPENISDFPSVQSRIGCKLIHAGSNREYLKKIPHIPYLDFAIVFYVLIDEIESSNATVIITDELLHLWNKSLAEIHLTAVKNGPILLPAEFRPMRAVICDILGDEPPVLRKCEECMYILTNSRKCFGASCILYNHILEQISNQLGENFFILPCSIHELIIVPESKSPSMDDLNNMVKEINGTQLSPEEILSDHAYYYNAKTDEITF